MDTNKTNDFTMRSIIYKFSNKDWFNTNKFLKN